MKRWAQLSCLLALALGCRERASGSVRASASVGLASSAPALDDHARGLAQVEARRDASALDLATLTSADLRVRRRAVQALARIADDKAVELLGRTLADADREVISWSAYGLGYGCRGHEPAIERALIARAASLAGVIDHGESPLAAPEAAIADALGRCGGREAEETLCAWLSGPPERAEAAALALGRIAGTSGQLADATLVTLLDVATREHPLGNALYPFTRLASLNASVGARLLTQARAVLERATIASEFAVRALGRVEDGGPDALLEAVTRSSLPFSTRASAARELGRLGMPAQGLLLRALSALVRETPSDASLLEPGYGLVSTLLAGVRSTLAEPPAALALLASLPLSGHETHALARRKVHLRCSAAALLAGSATSSPRLLGCDPQKSGREGTLALLRVLDRAPLTGSRARALRESMQSEDALVREAALGLIAAHPELDGAYRLLASALASPAPGVVANAARILASYPNRAAAQPTSNEKAAPRPDPSVIEALLAAFQRLEASPNLELKAALIDAAGALELLGLKEKIVAACASDNPTLREHAEKALHLLGDGSRKCADARSNGTPAAGEASVHGRYQLELKTDVGDLSLTLDGKLAPLAVERVVELARAHFYDGLVVHRVVPGFVAQFGDPGGDGYGGADRPALRCETAPLPFEPGSVGIALAGRDTGNSQLFVTLGRHPYLDGDYTWIGRAGPGWERLAEGDVIEHATLAAAPP